MVLVVYGQGEGGTRTAPGKQAGNKQKRDENIRVPDFRCAAHYHSGAARYALTWNIFCTVILGMISHPVDDDADGSAQDDIFPIPRSPAPCLARSARLVHRYRLTDCKLQEMPP